jgi:hypothetical protein
MIQCVCTKPLCGPGRGRKACFTITGGSQTEVSGVVLYTMILWHIAPWHEISNAQRLGLGSLTLPFPQQTGADKLLR